MINLSVRPNAHVQYRVRYEDDELLVVEKPAKLVTQPGLGHEEDTLLNGLFFKCGATLQNLGKTRDFGLLHRLDRETSGLLVVALRARTYDRLREMFEQREIAKYYWAVVQPPPNRPTGVIRRPIAEYEADDRRVRKLARVSSGGKPAVTAYRVLNASNLGAVIECRAVTGRLHQIRVHMESIGSPIVGDGLYGPRVANAGRLALHAHRLKFVHPATGVVVDVDSPWPKDLKAAISRLRLQRPETVASTGVERPEKVDSDAVLDEDPGVGEDQE
ncbi:MAG: RluA family pseudouridine synthase [Phycisphaerales bacterium]